MHIREQGNSLQLVRTVYNKEKKRGEQKVVAKMPRYSYTIPKDVWDLLTPPEQDQLKDYLIALETGRKQQLQEYHLASLVEVISQAVGALKSGAIINNVDQLWASLADLHKALSTAGYKKPGKARKTEPVPNAVGL